jgi:hypothetical protein
MKIIFDHLHGHVMNDRVFCEAFVIPEGESEDYLLENGWLPAIQPPIYWYQSQSIRINSDKVILNKKMPIVVVGWASHRSINQGGRDA